MLPFLLKLRIATPPSPTWQTSGTPQFLLGGPLGARLLMAARRQRSHLPLRPANQPTAMGPVESPAGLESPSLFPAIRPNGLPGEAASHVTAWVSEGHSSLCLKPFHHGGLRCWEGWARSPRVLLQTSTLLGQPIHSCYVQPPAQISSSFVVSSLRDLNVLQSSPRLEDYLPHMALCLSYSEGRG